MCCLIHTAHVHGLNVYFVYVPVYSSQLARTIIVATKISACSGIQSLYIIIRMKKSKDFIVRDIK